jgi:sulfate adenylyltransferase
VVSILRSTYRPREKQGFTVFFTGLSGSGKTTLANSLRVRLLQEGSRTVELLDGDVIRTHLSSELGFSKEHRDLNICRMGFVASCITKAGGVAICCAIAPYDGARQKVKKLVESSGGGFLLVHVASPLEFCEGNDVKGLYKKARAGTCFLSLSFWFAFALSFSRARSLMVLSSSMFCPHLFCPSYRFPATHHIPMLCL